MNQQALQLVEIPLSEVARKPSLGRAIEYCAELAGYSYDKELEHALRAAGVKVDATQLTRWKQGVEGVKWEKLAALMDACGNDAPLLWMLHARGYDLSSLRRRETETERRLRMALEENAALRRVLQGQGA
ncbi:MAG: hypothetical protein HS128_23390 [Ideonella sp.]|nr:hypothetical protein [Ideonella sp.]